MLSKHSKNMLWVFSGDTGSKLLGFLATVYLARVIGDEGYGMVSIGLAVLAYGIMFISSGIPLYGTQMVASAVKNIACFTGNVIRLRIVLATLAVGVTVICVMVFAPTGALGRVITIYALFLFPLSLSLEWFFQGKSRMAVVAVSRFIQIVIYLLFILYTVDHINHVNRVAWGWVAGGLGAAAWTWWQFRRSNYPIRITRDLRRLLDLWKNSLPLGVAMLITQVVQQFPFIYMGWRYDNAAAGQFGVAFRLMLALLVLDRIFYTVFFPAISRQAARQVQSLSATVNTITKSVGVVALITAMAAVLLAPWMIPVLFSDTYHSAVPLFQIMAGYFACSFFNSVIGYTLVALGYYRKYTRAFVFSFALYSGAIFLFSHWFELNGISLALTFFQSLVLAINTFYLNRALRINWFRGILLPAITAGILLTGILTQLDWHPLARSFLALLLGLPILGLAAGFSREDAQLIKKALL